MGRVPVPDERLEKLAAIYRPQAKVMEQLTDAFATNDPVEIATAYRALGESGRPAAGLVEESINVSGYQLLGTGQIGAAIVIFQLNTDLFPESSNSWDSLAEAFMTHGDEEKAIEYYRKSLELNPDNRNAERMIERMIE